jgi:hypothetical protein
MKITRAWLASTPHCEDGRAFGLEMVGHEGLELADCWPLIKRADWALSLGIQTGAITFADGRAIVANLLRLHARELGHSAAVDLLDDLAAGGEPVRIKELAASFAYGAICIGSDEHEGDRFNAIAQLASSDIAARSSRAERDPETGQSLAMSRLQGAAYGLGRSMGHKAAAELVIGRILARVPVGDRHG